MRAAGGSQRLGRLMFDESNLAELRLNVSELGTKGGRSRRTSHVHFREELRQFGEETIQMRQ